MVGEPSKEFAMIRGEDAYQKVLTLLKEKYHVDRPHIIQGVLHGEKFGCGKRSQEEWDEQAKQLKEILQELIWTSDAASW